MIGLQAFVTVVLSVLPMTDDQLARFSSSLLRSHDDWWRRTCEHGVPLDRESRRPCEHCEPYSFQYWLEHRR